MSEVLDGIRQAVGSIERVAPRTERTRPGLVA